MEQCQLYYGLNHEYALLQNKISIQLIAQNIIIVVYKHFLIFVEYSN